LSESPTSLTHDRAGDETGQRAERQSDRIKAGGHTECGTDPDTDNQPYAANRSCKAFMSNSSVVEPAAVDETAVRRSSRK